MPFNKWQITLCMFIITVLSFIDSPAQNKKQQNEKNKNCSFSVCIKDSSTGLPLEYANFVVLKYEDSTQVTGGVSDNQGIVCLDIIKPGHYLAKVSYTGYRAKVYEKVIVGDESTAAIDTVSIVQQSISVGEVKVTAEKEKIVYEKDKIVFNVGKDFMSIGGSALDVLENAPLVKVDIDDNISLAGKSDIEILIDGVPISSMGISAKDYLRTIRWFEIDKVEIMQNPPVEYDAAGKSGAINIITKKLSDKRFSGSLDGRGTTKNEYNAGLSLSYMLKSLSFRGNVSGNYRNRDYSGNELRISNLNDEQVTLNQNRDVNSESLNNSYRFYISYNPDKNTSLSQSLSYSYFNSDNENKNLNTYSDENANPIDTRLITRDAVTNTGFFSYLANYMSSSEDKSQKFRMSLSFNNNLMNLKTDAGTLHTGNEMYDESKQQNYSLNKNNSYRVSTSYGRPLFAEFEMSTGYTFNFKNLNLQNNYYNLGQTGYIENLEDKSFQKYTEQNHRFYLQLSREIGKLTIRLPLELSWQLVNNKDDITKEKFNYDFFSLLPSIDFNWSFSRSDFLRASWSKNERFPMNKELNPHVDYSDSASITMGNPNLTPEKADRFILEYYDFSGLGGLTGGISYSRTKDIIESYTYLQNEATLVTTYRNIGKNWRASVFVAGEKDLIDWLSLELWFSMSKAHYDNALYEQRGVNWFFSAEPKISFKYFSFGVDLNYSSPSYTYQTKTDDYFYISIASKISLFEKRLFLALKINDLLNTSNNKSNTNGVGFISRSSSNETTRVFSLGLSYYFQDTQNPEEERQEGMMDDF